MAQHGIKSTFEIVGEGQVKAGESVTPPPEGFRFGRLFPQLPPFRPTDAALTALGQTMTRQIERDDSDIPAGYTYFGQFIDHDITHDGTPGLPVDAPQTLSADQIQQLRSPSLDLDSLYGDDHTRGLITDADGLRLRLGATTPSPRQVRPHPLDRAMIRYLQDTTSRATPAAKPLLAMSATTKT